MLILLHTKLHSSKMALCFLEMYNVLMYMSLYVNKYSMYCTWLQLVNISIYVDNDCDNGTRLLLKWYVGRYAYTTRYICTL